MPAGDRTWVTRAVSFASYFFAGTKTTVKMWFVNDKGIAKLSYKIQDAESILEMSKFEPPTGGTN